MRTLVLCYKSVILDSILLLEKEGLIDFVNILSEDDCNHEKNISRFRFLTFEYPDNVLNLIKKYSEGIEYDEEIYNQLYKNMYHYMCNIGRHNKDFQYVSDTEYLNSFNLMYKFLYGYLVKEKIELVIFDHTPHVGFDDILYDLCEAFGIKTIILQSCCSPVTNIPFILYAYKQENAVAFEKIDKKYRESNESLIEGFSYNHCYMKNIQKYEMDTSYPGFFFKRHHFLVAILKSGFSRKKFNKIIGKYFNRRYSMNPYLERKMPLYIQYDRNRKQYTKEPDYENEKFVYFPLHLQPELTTSVNGGIYCDQILAIERLSKLIPQDWYIYVKENPKQNEYMRGDLFFKRLHLINNVKYIDVSVPSSELLEKCEFCATIDGTASFESICGGKPTLIFGKVWWEFLPGVFKYNKDLDINDLMKYKIDKEELKQKYNEYLSKTMLGTLYQPEDYQEYCPELTKEVNARNTATLIKDLIENI